MILSGESLLAAIDSNKLGIVPFDKEQVKASFYALSIGQFGITSSIKRKTDLSTDACLVMNPGDYAAIECLEEIEIGRNMIGHFELNAKYAQLGLIINNNKHIGPGAKGKLVVQLVNLSLDALVFPYQDQMINLILHEITTQSRLSVFGMTTLKEALDKRDVEFITQKEGTGISQTNEKLEQLNKRTQQLKYELHNFGNTIKTYNWIFTTIMVIVLVTMVALIMRLN